MPETRITSIFTELEGQLYFFKFLLLGKFQAFLGLRPAQQRSDLGVVHRARKKGASGALRGDSDLVTPPVSTQ